MAEADGTVVGGVTLRDLGGGLARLGHLALQPEARGTGAGRRLVESVIEAARAAGYERVELMTFSALTEARELYRRTGFEMTSIGAHGPLGPRAGLGALGAALSVAVRRLLACAREPAHRDRARAGGGARPRRDRARGEQRRRRATGAGAEPVRRRDDAGPRSARPDFDLRDEQGKPVSMRALRGQPVVVTFLYSHCQDTCPITAQTIRGALDDLGHDVPALAISVDPPNDTPASARKFLAEQRANGRIRFVLGSRAQLRPIWKGYGVTPQRDHPGAPGPHHAGGRARPPARGLPGRRGHAGAPRARPAPAGARAGLGHAPLRLSPTR